jgi:hypothetical protein
MTSCKTLGKVSVTVGLSELMHRTEQLLRPNSGSISTVFTDEFFTIFLNSLALTTPNNMTQEISSTAFLIYIQIILLFQSNRYFSSLNEYHTAWKQKIHLNNKPT